MYATPASALFGGRWGAAAPTHHATSCFTTNARRLHATSSSSSSSLAPLPCVGAVRFAAASPHLQRRHDGGACASSSAATATCGARLVAPVRHLIFRRTAMRIDAAATDAASAAAASSTARVTAASTSTTTTTTNNNSSASDDTSYDQIPLLNLTVSRWLFGCAGMVFTIICVGGITRLTESGLSIVEWKPVTGMVPPLGDDAWEREFAKYQKYPEYAQNPDMTLKHFKWIFFWEWSHRFLARSVGLVFGLPLAYFTYKGYFRRQRAVQAGLFGILCLGAAQGALGWYMVKSGLDPKLVGQRRKATVSAYRLAAHLSLAVVLLASMVRLGLALRVTHRTLLARPRDFWDIRLLGRAALASLGLSIVSGAFVAGLDAGLLYNDCFPFMGETLFPAPEDVLVYPEGPYWRNFTENGVGAQLVHRMMAGTTAWLVLGLNCVMLWKRKRLGKDYIAPNVTKALKGVTHATVLQVLLGFATLIFYVPVSIAALHQANAIMTLVALLRLLATVGSRGIIKL